MMIRYPDLLTKEYSGFTVVILEALVWEAIGQQEDKKHIWLNRIEAARTNTNVTFIKKGHLAPGKTSMESYLDNAGLLSKGDFFIASNDSQAASVALNKGFKSINSAQLGELLQSSTIENAPINDLKFNIIIGIVVLSFIAFIYAIKDVISTNIVDGVIIFFLIVAGFFFFTIRERFRLAYSIVELGVGIGGMIFSLEGNEKVLAVAGSFYVMVSGLDNMAKGLSELKLPKVEKIFRKYLLLKDKTD